ncbi:Mobile element protein [Candidatus Nitrotoga sp. HW29]|nr:Mobile element protein [Candidatus Nitrotoga sp. HW29]
MIESFYRSQHLLLGDASFKLQVVHMITEQDLSASQIYTDINLGKTAIRRRLTRAQATQCGQLRLDKPLTADQIRIRELETQNRQLHIDNGSFCCFLAELRTCSRSC